MINLKKNNRNSDTVCCNAQLYQERKIITKNFNNFFQYVCVLAEFDPSIQKELTAYLKEMQLPLQDLTSMLYRRFLILQKFINPSDLLGRPFPSMSPARGMKSSTDVDNV